MGSHHRHRWRARTSAIGPVVGIGLTLFMLGVLGFLLINARGLERHFRENVRVELFLKRGLNEVEVMRFHKELGTEAFTRRTRYVTADEAAEQLKQELGEDFLGVLGSNPLSPSVELWLNAAHAHPDSLRWITERLQRDPRVMEVAYNTAVVESVDRNLRRLGLLVLGFAVLLLTIAVALINNTIRLSVYSKRFLIRTMHLVGATRWFIKKPFLAASLWQGLLGAMLATGLLMGLLHLTRRFMPDLLAFTDVPMLALLIAGMVVLGLIIALLSTWLAVGRYLRMDHEELHWS